MWDQLQREFLNEFRPGVGQCTALRALINVRQGKKEEISAYIRRFDMVCARYVGTLLNDDTLKQLFIQGFIKSNTIRGVLEKNPRTFAEAKVAARKMEHIDRDYQRLWKREDELILQFISLQPRIEVEPVRPLNQAPYAFIDSSPLPLAVREPILLLALPAPRVDPHVVTLAILILILILIFLVLSRRITVHFFILILSIPTKLTCKTKLLILKTPKS